MINVGQDGMIDFAPWVVVGPLVSMVCSAIMWAAVFVVVWMARRWLWIFVKLVLLKRK